MKKPVALILALLMTFSLCINSYAEEESRIVSVFNYRKMLIYDANAADLNDAAIAKGKASFFDIFVAIGGIDVAKSIDLGVAVFQDGKVAIRHRIKDGYMYHFENEWYISKQDGKPHILVPQDVVNVICNICNSTN